MAAYRGRGMNNHRRLVVALGASVLAAPFASFAQAPAVRLARIGLLGPGTVFSNESLVAALLKQLRDLGYVEGKNLGVESRWSEGKNDRLPDLAVELVRLKVDLIVTFQTPAGLAAKQATN